MKTKENKNDPIVEVVNLRQYFSVSRLAGLPFLGQNRDMVKAVDGVSFTIRRGETLGIVGETGCGKTTLARSLIRIYRPTSGQIRLNGLDIAVLPEKKLAPLRRQMQMIFQDPAQSMNPRHTVGYIIEEPLVIRKSGHSAMERRQLALRMLESVGLSGEHYHRYPHEFSGGQRQRLAVARALIISPAMILCDEPVSALDVSVQSQIINLILKQQRQRGLTLLFITHDLSVARHVSDRIAVMYLGKIVELAACRQLFDEPAHPYTQALISAIPRLDNNILSPQRIILQGDIPSPVNPPSGCRFHSRCPQAFERCRLEKPHYMPIAENHYCSCHLVAG